MIHIVVARRFNNYPWHNLIAFYEYEDAIRWMSEPANTESWTEMRIDEISIN